MDAVLVTTSSSIVCLAGHVRKDGTYVIAGQTSVPFSGIRKGKAVTSFGMSKGISDVVLKLEEQTGKRIKQLHVGVPASFCKVELISPLAQHPNEAGEINPPASFEYMSDTHELIHRIQVPNIGAAHYGRGQIASISADRTYISEVNNALDRLKMRAVSFHSQPLAEGLFVLPKPQRSAIAVLLDVGYYNIGISIFAGDALVYGETLYVGGFHVINDLCVVMDIPVEYAEQLKRQFSFGIAYEADAQDYVRSKEGKMVSFDHAKVADIIKARVEETAFLIGQGLDHAPLSFTDKSVAIMVGDGYEGIRGIREYLSAHVGLPVQGLPLSLADGSTHYETAALARFDALAVPTPAADNNDIAEAKPTRRPSWTSRFTKR